MSEGLTALAAGCSSALWIACAGPLPHAGAELPRACVLEQHDARALAIAAARVAACTDPAGPDEAARCDREDYLEAVCTGLEAYRARLMR